METKERNIKIKQLRDDGWTYKDLSEEFNISRQRAEQICSPTYRKNKGMEKTKVYRNY